MKRSVIFLIFLFFLVSVGSVSAQLTPESRSEINRQAIETGRVGGFLTGSGPAMLGNIIETIIAAVLSLLGIIFIILMIIAGYNWMTAGGDEQKVSKSKDTIRHAIIGLVVVLSAYLITYFVFTLIPFGDGSGGGGGGGTVTPFD